MITYSQYRSYGHSRLTAFTLAHNFWINVALIVAGGTFVGYIFARF